ncbi:MAG TPA: four helix bundle protein [Terriglobales bacterium]|nr:four helix bundle protein [Terriglobales bacterium]
MSNSYRDLIVWQKAVALSLKIYQATEAFPKHEFYGLAGQIRRASVSIACNIAEGQGRNSKGEFHHFLGMAKGSLLEVETQLLIGTKLAYISAPKSMELEKIAKKSLGF